MIELSLLWFYKLNRNQLYFEGLECYKCIYETGDCFLNNHYNYLKTSCSGYNCFYGPGI